MLANNKKITRRRTLQLFAVSAGLSAVGSAAMSSDSQFHRWSGVALGADAEMLLRHKSADEAERLFKLAEVEIGRLESIFSLSRPDSALMELNRAGKLIYPPSELLEVLSICGAIHRATEGAFDPAIQALWAYHAETATGAAAPNEARFESLRVNSGWRHVTAASGEIALASYAAALTLNGIAQGYITDRIANLMRDNGMTNVLVSLGEIAVIGRRSASEPWRVGIAGESGSPAASLDLVDTSIATSAPRGTTFDQKGLLGHILDPRSGLPATSAWRQISVIHPSAAIADGLSTGLSILDAASIARALKNFRTARAIAFEPSGRRVTIGPFKN